MRILGGVIKEVNLPLFTVTVSDSSKTYDLDTVEFCAPGPQDQATIYPNVGDTVLVESYSAGENFIIGGLDSIPPPINIKADHLYDTSLPQVEIDIAKGALISSYDALNFIAGSVGDRSCRLELTSERLNIILTKPGDYNVAEGWYWYDIPFIRDNDDTGSLETGNQELLVGFLDAINLANIHELLGGTLPLALLGLIDRLNDLDFVYKRLPVSLRLVASQVHQHPIEVIDFLPIRLVWRRQDD